jgi:hypothetical protein
VVAWLILTITISVREKTTVALVYWKMPNEINISGEFSRAFTCTGGFFWCGWLFFLFLFFCCCCWEVFA